MSQSTTSDLVSTIATQLNIVIVALRLLVDMIQNPDATSPADMTPGSCPSRPPASPASPPFRTTTIPSISWAPCEQPALSLTRQQTPSPTLTSSVGKRTFLAHPSSPPLSFPPSPILSPPEFAYPPPSSLAPPPPSPSPSCSLVSSAPHGPLPSRPRKRRSPSPSPSLPIPSTPLRHFLG